MRVHGTPYRTLWMEGGVVRMIDQTRLPFEFVVVDCQTHHETAAAVREMVVRGAPALGAAGAFAMAQGFAEAPSVAPWPYARDARALIAATRPTARDLFAGIEHVWSAAEASPHAPADAALAAALAFAEASVESCRMLGEHGAALIPSGARVLTHCNAGWLATVDHGSALAPVFAAAGQGRPPFVWVDETRPRGQGARLTAWELSNEELPHAVIADNAAAHYMSRGEVDLVIVGADRIAANGDVVNKVGTLAKAVCAREFGIPFYVAAPPSTFDAATANGASVEIEERGWEEVHYQTGPDEAGAMHRIRVTSPGSPARNPAFDATPARLVTGYVTDRGVLTLDQLRAAAAGTDSARAAAGATGA
ncbi:MAG TPA: S-methyl-5-thioribose-1-phosphate isomerase [Longimicrobium sp.]|nr:S-methyl-5-thioribose-1-phosphate isomerase [Longimicrobium sp.]